jgi:hypothetical protein
VLSSSEGTHSKEFLMQGATVTLGDFGTFPIAGLAVDYAIGSTQSSIEIGAGSKIATLLLQGFGDAHMVIWDEDSSPLRY